MSKTAVLAMMIVWVSTTVQGKTVYVSLNSGFDGPGTGWNDGYWTIQGGVNAASNGDTVLVDYGSYDSGATATPGYSCLNRVLITNSITVKSRGGYMFTEIKGAASSGGGNGSDAVRGVYITSGKLVGFTIRGGYTMDSGDDYHDKSGGGIYMDGIMSSIVDSAIIGCSAGYGGRMCIMCDG